MTHPFRVARGKGARGTVCYCCSTLLLLHGLSVLVSRLVWGTSKVSNGQQLHVCPLLLESSNMVYPISSCTLVLLKSFCTHSKSFLNALLTCGVRKETPVIQIVVKNSGRSYCHPRNREISRQDTREENYSPDPSIKTGNIQMIERRIRSLSFCTGAGRLFSKRSFKRLASPHNLTISKQLSIVNLINVPSHNPGPRIHTRVVYLLLLIVWVIHQLQYICNVRR